MVQDRNVVLTMIEEYAESNMKAKKFVPGETYIPPAAPLLTPADVKMVGYALLDFWYTEHKWCRRFEKELTKIFRKSNVVLTNSGSSASLIAISTATKYMNQKRYVVTCAVGFPTTVAPIIQCGKIPIFIDMNENFEPDYDQLYSVLNDGQFRDDIAGVIFAHTLGFPFDEKRVRDMLTEDQFLIADCCDAVGCTLEDGNLPGMFNPVGTYADMVTVSFFPSHHIMAGEGGAVLTSDDDLKVHLDSFNNWGRSCYCRPGESNTCGHRFDWPNIGTLPKGWDHKYVFSNLGYNLKMTEFQGALGYSQALRVDDIVHARKLNYQYLYTQLYHGDISKCLYLQSPMNPHFSPFGFPIQVINFSHDTHELTTEMIAFLEEHKVGTRRLFGGNLTRQPGFMHEDYLIYDNLNDSDILARSTFWISVSPSLTREMMDYMVYVIELFLIEKGLIEP